MTIEELEDKHYEIDVKSAIEDKVNPKSHTNLSIEFTIDILDYFNGFGCVFHEDFERKIQELKQYLDEKV